MSLKLIIAKVFAVIVALQILNMSIYTCEFEAINQTKTTSPGIDETDSFVEFIAEDVIAHENLDKNSSNDKSKENRYYKDVQLKLFPPVETNISINTPTVSVEVNTAFIITYNYLFFKEFNPPPSQQVA